MQFSDLFLCLIKRAPGRKKGGKAHGPKPRILRYPLNKKIRLQGRIAIT